MCHYFCPANINFRHSFLAVIALPLDSAVCSVYQPSPSNPAMLPDSRKLDSHTKRPITKHPITKRPNH